MNRWLALLPVALLAIAGGLAAIALMRAAPPPPPGGLVGQPFPAWVAPDGPDVGGAPVIVNVFASWCQPCRAEHPLLMDLAARGRPIIGVAWKDAPANADEFLEELGDPFTHIVYDAEGRFGDRLGVSGAPETFVVGADGVIQTHWRGPLNRAVVARAIEPAFAQPMSNGPSAAQARD